MSQQMPKVILICARQVSERSRAWQAMCVSLWCLGVFVFSLLSHCLGLFTVDGVFVVGYLLMCSLCKSAATIKNNLCLFIFSLDFFPCSLCHNSWIFADPCLVIGFPQGLFVGPVLFSLCSQPLSDVIFCHANTHISKEYYKIMIKIKINKK